MRIFLHSFTFWPRIGGVENVSHILASFWASAGNDVTVVTETPSDRERTTPYRIVRNPTTEQAHELISSCDIVHSNGASVRYFAAAKRYRKPFVWTHPAYQLQCIDGFGWWHGQPAPLHPWSSVVFHVQHQGLAATLPGLGKLLVRRLIAERVDANIAVSHHQARRQPLPRQRVIYNPVDLGRFLVSSREEAQAQLAASAGTVTYLGRLISEKGVDDLVRAFADLVRKDPRGRPLVLRIIGDGPERPALEKLAGELGVGGQVQWLGFKEGDELVSEVRASGICVIPSRWEEPMGIVVVELMAAGKPLVVSQTGGLSECAGNACLTFPNGDAAALARVLEEVLSSPGLQDKLIENGLRRVRDFDPQLLSSQYLDLFSDLVARKSMVQSRH
ncbi:MAG TPA: glycosyltransferase family 4 protein [Candidatus Obscuribacterales bacterium]